METPAENSARDKRSFRSPLFATLTTRCPAHSNEPSQRPGWRFSPNPQTLASGSHRFSARLGWGQEREKIKSHTSGALECWSRPGVGVFASPCQSISKSINCPSERTWTPPLPSIATSSSQPLTPAAAAASPLASCSPCSPPSRPFAPWQSQTFF